jgi:hypothetical protein
LTIHDDTTILGDTESIFSEGGARQQLATYLANVGSELHEIKTEAYGLTPEDRAQIPEVIKQPSTIWTNPVAGVQLVGHGIVYCGISFGDDAFILATLDKAADSICHDIHRLIGGISNFLAGAIPPRLTKYFCAKIDHKHCVVRRVTSALGTNLLAAPADAVPDVVFTADRAQLQAARGRGHLPS